MFQIQQLEIDKLEISFVPDSTSFHQPDKNILMDHFVKLLDGPIDLQLNSVDQLTRSSGGKRERIVSAIGGVTTGTTVQPDLMKSNHYLRRSP
jgi:hypothetical protein